MKQRIGLGMIVRDFTDARPITDFILNGLSFGWEIECVIVAYSGKLNAEASEAISALLPLKLIPVMERHELWEFFAEQGLEEHEAQALLTGPKEAELGWVPYGKNRNQVLIQAMKMSLDTLFFIDHDVWPYHLVHHEGQVREEALDFIGGHLKYLNMPEVMATTSDYTGFYIVPELPFEGASQLLSGLQKSQSHGVLVTDEGETGLSVVQTTKVLGGNVALKLKAFERLLPFYSATYVFEGQTYLARGEDTLLAAQLGRSEDWVCLDVDMRIFHNPFGNYPQIPSLLEDESTKDRFYYACMGWIGRNPFLNWISGVDPESCALEQRMDLEKGSHALAQWLGDDRFEKLPMAMDAALDQLPEMIENYKAFSAAWMKWTQQRRMRGL